MPITFNDEKLAKEFQENWREEGKNSKIERQGGKYIVTQVFDEVTCPFCGETGFDKTGLKSHLEHGDCDKYNNLEGLNRLF